MIFRKNSHIVPLGLLLWVGLALAAPAEAETSEQGELVTRPGISYNHYQYNYPHEIPTDYVFRTDRVFSPWEVRHSEAAARETAARGAAPTPAPAGERGGLSDGAVGALVAELLGGVGEDLRERYTLAVSTPVSLRDLYATSSFGRLLGEQLLGELQRAGVDVVDVRKTPALLISERHGEYGLSRDMDELPYVQDVQAVLVGTYTATAERVQVELRVLRNRDGRIISSARRDFDMDREIVALLADEAAPLRAATPVKIER